MRELSGGGGGEFEIFGAAVLPHGLCAFLLAAVVHDLCASKLYLAGGFGQIDEVYL